MSFPAHITPTIEWQVAGACNYDCTYCIQSRKYRRGRPERDNLENALSAFEALPGTWEIKMSGGEAFAHPLFMELIVPELVRRTPHRVSVLTNFSAANRDLMRFVHLTRGRLSVFSASLHLEFVRPEAFADKAAWFVSQLDPDVRFVVNQVVLPGRLDEVARCRDLLRERGIRWFPQLYKVKHKRLTPAEQARVSTPPDSEPMVVYPYADQAAVAELIGGDPSPKQANTAPNYQGRRCHAGVAYVVVDKDGACWSCRTAKRNGARSLGNLFDGSFQRLTTARPCPWTMCPCTVPANRGMIEGVGPAEAVHG